MTLYRVRSVLLKRRRRTCPRPARTSSSTTSPPRSAQNHFSEKILQGMSPYRTLQACAKSASQAFSTQTACISSTCERTSNCTRVNSRVTRSRRCARVTRFHWVPCATETRQYAAGLVLVQRPTPCPPTKRAHTFHFQHNNNSIKHVTQTE